MATRMQQRRGTAQQWTDADPRLESGEIGFETDTNQFKIGDGVNVWSDLSYFKNLEDLGGSLDDYALANLIGAANGIASLDATGQVPISQLSNIIDGAPELLNTINELAAAINDNASFANTVLTSVDSAQAAAQSFAQEFTTNAIANAISTEVTNRNSAISTHEADSSNVHGIANTLALVTTTALEANANNLTTAYSNAIANSATTVTTAYQLADSTHANTTANVHGIADTSALATKTYADSSSSNAQAAAESTAATALSGHANTTSSVHGISNTLALATTSQVETARSNAISVAGTAADSKVSTAVAALTKSSVGLGNVDNTADSAKPVSTATQTALDLKANLAGPTFTGTVVLPSTTSIGNVSSTEIGYVDGVTSAIQTQIDSKLSKSGGTMTGDLTLAGAPSSDLHAATKAYVDNVVSGINFHQPVRVATTANITLSGTQTIDGVSLSVGDRVLVKDQTTQTQNGIYVVASGAWSRATDADNNPTGELAGGDFCLVLEGTVGSGYGYVCSNTSTITVGSTNVTYVAFNAAKAITAGSGLTESTPGTLDIATGGVTSTMILDGTIVDGDINASAAIAQSKISGLTSDLAAKAPLASPTFTGTVTVASAGVAFTDGTQSKEGTPSRTPIIQKTASYTLSALTERDSMIEVSNTSATTITIPTNATLAYPVGTSIDILQTSTGQVTVAGAAGVTVNATPGLKLRTQWSGATLFKRATDTWVVYGDLSA